MSQLKFGAAPRLLRAGLPSKGIQVFLDRFADTEFLPNTFAEKMSGRFIVCEDPTNANQIDVYFFDNDKKYWAAVKALSERTPLHFATIQFDSILREVVERISAWSNRREYVHKSAGEMVARALSDYKRNQIQALQK